MDEQIKATSASATSNAMARTPRPCLAAKERQATASQVGMAAPMEMEGEKVAETSNENVSERQVTASQVGMAAPAEMEGEKVAETSNGTGGDGGRESRGDGVILGCSTLLQFVFWFECRVIKHAGLDLKQFVECIKEGAAGSKALEIFGERMIEGDFRPGGQWTGEAWHARGYLCHSEHQWDESMNQ